MSYLSREDILKADDLPTRDVDVPEWGGTVRVRGLSGADRDEYEASMAEMRGDKMVPMLANMRAKLVARAIVDEDGNRLFNELDIGRLGQKSGLALQRVFEAAQELSGLGERAEEEAAGNSGAEAAST